MDLDGAISCVTFSFDDGILGSYVSSPLLIAQPTLTGLVVCTPYFSTVQPQEKKHVFTLLCGK